MHIWDAACRYIKEALKRAVESKEGTPEDLTVNKNNLDKVEQYIQWEPRRALQYWRRK